MAQWQEEEIALEYCPSRSILNLPTYNALESTVTNRNKPTAHLAPQWKRGKILSFYRGFYCVWRTKPHNVELYIKSQIENHIKEAFEDLDVGK